MTLHAWWADVSGWLWPALANHLWQATLLAFLALAASLALRRARAGARHAIWLVVMAKFALPSALLAPLAGLWPAAAVSDEPEKPARYVVLPALMRWTSPAPAADRHSEFYCALSGVWLAGCLSVLAMWRSRRFQVCGARPLVSGREWEALHQAQPRLGLRRSVRLLSAETGAPLVWGAWRPTIVLPEGVSADLSDAELNSLFLHELLHVKGWHNLLASAQMLVCCIFWFHPLVWWVDRKIRAERERSCDEKVLELSRDSESYMAGILKVCRFCLAARTPGVSCAGGANLKERMEGIMTFEIRNRWRLAQVIVLTVTVTGALALSLIAAGSPPQQTAPPSKAARLSSPYMKWLEQDVAYIISDGEKALFLKLTSDPQREQFIEQFWLRRDPTPGTAANEFKEEHYRRIAYSNERLGANGVPGWRTDRGRIYILFGPPDEIESHPARQIDRWRYHTGPLAGAILEFSTR